MPRDSGVEFSESVIEMAWDRQNGLCLGCGKKLVWGSRCGDISEREYGCWQAHHIDAVVEKNGDGTLDNCGIVCVNCHTILSDKSNKIDTIRKLRNYKRSEIIRRQENGVKLPKIPPGSRLKVGRK